MRLPSPKSKKAPRGGLPAPGDPPAVVSVGRWEMAAWLLPLLYLGAIIAAESITVFLSQWGGVVFHAVLLAVLILHAALAPRQAGRLFLALSLAPLTRILSLSIPLIGFPPVYWYLILSLPLFVAAAVVMRLLNFTFVEVGLSLRRLRFQLLVGATGVGLGAVEFLILRSPPLVSEFSLAAIWLPALMLLFGTGFVEEFIFRGVLQRASLGVFGPWGILYVSVVFATLHLGYGSAWDLAFVFGVALFFGWVVNRTGSLLGVALSHGITNIMLFLVVPFFA